MPFGRTTTSSPRSLAPLLRNVLPLALLTLLPTSSASTPTTATIPAASTAAYPYSLAASYGFDVYATLPFPSGAASAWAVETSTSTDDAASSTKTSTTKSSTKTKTSSSSTAAAAATKRSSSSSSSSVINNATASTPLLSNQTVAYITEDWDLYNHIEFGQDDVTFVDDPEVYGGATGDGQQVLRVEYPEGSYSHSTGGTQFFSTIMNSSSPDALLLTYSIYVPANFSFNKGGKLPGLRAGSDAEGCSGGDQTNVGTGCWSARLMWRTSGEGEVYAYIPTSTALCAESNVICDTTYGTSLGRGSFTLEAGAWNEIGLYVKLNTATGSSDGIIQLFYNGVQAISFTNLQLVTSTKLGSIGGLFFSTFFGGDDSTWASVADQYLYFKDLAVWGSSTEGTGVAASGAAGRAAVAGWAVAAVLGVSAAWMGGMWL